MGWLLLWLLSRVLIGLARGLLWIAVVIRRFLTWAIAVARENGELRMAERALRRW